jgi:hypothetical protein
VSPYASPIATPSTRPPFERTSKRRRGFPSETRVKRGDRVVHGDKELQEKLGRRDPCPCGSGLRFQGVLHARRRILTGRSAMIIGAASYWACASWPRWPRGTSSGPLSWLDDRNPAR